MSHPACNGATTSPAHPVAVLVEQMAQRGADRTAIFSESARANGAHPEPIPDGEFFRLVASATRPAEPQKLPPESGNAPQTLGHSDTRETQDSHRHSPSVDPADAGPRTTEREGTQEEKTEEKRPMIEMPLDLPLDEYLIWAWQRHRADEEAREGMHVWRSPLFTFTRLCKAHPDLCGLTPGKAFAKVGRVLASWLKNLQKTGNPWQAYFGESPDPQMEFATIWKKLRYLPGLGPLDNASDESGACPLSLSPETLEWRSAAYEKFVSLAGWLQVVMGARPIFLPGDRLRVVLEVDKRTIGRYCQAAIEDGFLRKVAEAEFRKRRAAEYVFDVTRFPVLLERAAPGTAEMFRQATG